MRSGKMLFVNGTCVYRIKYKRLRFSCCDEDEDDEKGRESRAGMIDVELSPSPAKLAHSHFPSLQGS